MVGAGATIVSVIAGALRELLEETVGAGWTTEVLRARAARDWSRTMLEGAGAITFDVRLGEVREECKPSDGGGPGMDLTARRLATGFGEEGSLTLGASTTFGTSEVPRATWMVWVRWWASWPPAWPEAPD